MMTTATDSFARVLLAESAVLLGLHPIRMVFLFLGRVVITLLALGACQCNLHSHNSHLRIKLGIKKRPLP